MAKDKKNKKPAEDVEEEIPEDVKASIAVGTDQPKFNSDEIDEQMDGSATSRMSVLTSMIKKLGIGADLTSVTIPGAFVLPRSTLSYFSDYYTAHFDLLLIANEIEDEKERFLQVYRYLASTSHVVEDTSKKPLNPILGETYQAKVTFSPTEPDKEEEHAYFFAEQISHHPPISSTFVYNKKHGISVSYHHPVKSTFMGTYVKLSIEGEVLIKFEKFNEVYKTTCPHMAIRIFRSFSEYIGHSELTCNKNDYRVKTKYYPKPLLYGQYNYIESKVYKGKEKIYKVKGQWDNELKYAPYKSDDYKIFFRRNLLIKGDVHVPPVTELLPTDSSIVWSELFEACKTAAPSKTITAAKTKVEEEQRKKVIERKEKNITWKPEHFHQLENGEWVLTNQKS